MCSWLDRSAGSLGTPLWLASEVGIVLWDCTLNLWSLSVLTLVSVRIAV